MAITLFFPYVAVLPNGQKIPMQGMTVESLPVNPDGFGENLILTKQVGVFGPGAYQWVNNRWQFILSYSTICSELYGVSQVFVALPNAGDNLIPIGDSGAATVTVYKNGIKIPVQTAYSVTTQGISLVNPAKTNDVFAIIQESPIKATTPLGVTEAPANGLAYVRKDDAWELLQNELNEGSFNGQ